MNEPSDAGATALPSPAPALERRFDEILRTQMQGVPMVNPALRVQAIGFQPWQQHWLGVLVTPWFMNLMLLPRQREHWHTVGERQSRHYVFPAGVFEFISGHDVKLGDYQACSLFSPMFDFADDTAAHGTATAAMQALFDAATRPVAPLPASAAVTATASPGAGPSMPVPVAVAAPTPAVSKRDFLFGAARRDRREP